MESKASFLTLICYSIIVIVYYRDTWVSNNKCTWDIYSVLYFYLLENINIIAFKILITLMQK